MARAASREEWQAELHHLMEFRDAAPNERVREMMSVLIDMLIEALADPKSAINKED